MVLVLTFSVFVLAQVEVERIDIGEPESPGIYYTLLMLPYEL